MRLWAELAERRLAAQSICAEVVTVCGHLPRTPARSGKGVKRCFLFRLKGKLGVADAAPLAFAVGDFDRAVGAVALNAGALIQGVCGSGQAALKVVGIAFDGDAGRVDDGGDAAGAVVAEAGVLPQGIGGDCWLVDGVVLLGAAVTQRIGRAGLAA